MTWKTPFLASVFVGILIIPKLFNRPDPQVLAESTSLPTVSSTPAPSATPTPTLSPTPTAAPTPSPKPKPTPKPIPTPKPQPKYSPEEIYNFTNNFAIQYGIDPNVLRHVALCESGFRPDAKNGIYIGLFQYDAPTWRNIRTLMGLDPDPDLRYNAQAAVQTTAYALSKGKSPLWPNCYPH